MTNGLDYKTREAIQYWRKCGLDVRPWIYRIYRGNNEMLLEVSPFAVNDNPYSDLAEEGFYIVNTNYRHDPANHEDMLKNRKAAAYSDPWKFKIERLKKNDVVYLYQSGKGIVALGKASGKLEKRAHHGHPDEEYSMSLTHFARLSHPITAANVKEITGVDYRFMNTMFALDADSGKALYEYAMGQIADKK